MHIRVQGRVQGVGYRAWAQRTARRYGLAGWVRNITDGTVEVLASGPAAAVQQFVGDCHAGPTSARVTLVEAREVTAAVMEPGFVQRDTCPPAPPPAE